MHYLIPLYITFNIEIKSYRKTYLHQIMSRKIKFITFLFTNHVILFIAFSTNTANFVELDKSAPEKFFLPFFQLTFLKYNMAGKLNFGNATL